MIAALELDSPLSYNKSSFATALWRAKKQVRKVRYLETQFFFWVYNNCREHYVYLPTEKPAVFVWWTYALNLATCDI